MKYIVISLEGFGPKEYAQFFVEHGITAPPVTIKQGATLKIPFASNYGHVRLGVTLDSIPAEQQRYLDAIARDEERLGELLRLNADDHAGREFVYGEKK